MTYLFKKGRKFRAHILVNGRTLCQIENVVSEKGLRKWQRSEIFPGDRTICDNCWQLHRVPVRGEAEVSP